MRKSSPGYKLPILKNPKKNPPLNLASQQRLEKNQHHLPEKNQR
jgi:hypothetical protein